MFYRFLRRLSVAHRIIGGILVIVLLLTLVIPFILGHQVFLVGRLRHVTNVETHSDRLLLLAASRVASSRMNLLRYLSDYQPSAWKSLKDANQVTMLLEDAQQVIQRPGQKEMVVSVSKVVQEYKSMVSSVQ